MPSPKIMAHTRMRFNTMSAQKLWTRMGKVTNPEKLEAFSLVADENDMPDLAVAANARLAMLTGQKITSHAAKPKTMRSVDTGRALRRLDG